MHYEIVEAQSYWDCLNSLRHRDRYKAALVDTLLELRRKPFQNAKLSTHGVGEAANGKKLYASDVGGRRSDRRVVWQLYSRTIVLLLYGTHQIYTRAKRMSVEYDPAERVLQTYERAPETGTRQPYTDRRVQVGKLFMSWTDEELLTRGFPEPMVSLSP